LLGRQVRTINCANGPQRGADNPARGHRLDRNTPVLIIDRADGGSLQDLLCKEVLAEREKLNACLDIAHGINAIHSYGIIHRDVKPQKILVAQACSSDKAQVTWIAKIGDFGGAIMDAHDGWLGTLRTPLQP
jgi:serine/threonine protein kinase